ncbi:MAG: hypothetical protein II916_04125 [Oscillospiraceae bacterium]|nr:hypothetical protein [Oscillospiraceae bacterium]
MRCNVCGRELKDGQMFCQCGNTVGQADFNAGALNVNRSSGKTMLIAAIAGFAVLAALVMVVVGVILGSGSNIKDRTKWETVSCADYQMTIPGGMKEADVVDHQGSGMTHLNTYRNSSVVIDVNMIRFTAEQKRYFKRKKFIEMFKEVFPYDEVEGTPVTPTEHGNMIYIEYPQDANGAFLGSSKAWVVDACFVSNDAFYEVEVFTPQDKYPEYEEYVFAWLDSFRAK